jgi:MEDS: MEthanogen/methylotroph, DcmR Sensory domain
VKDEDMAEGSRAVRLAGSVLDCRCHVCAFFHNRHDEYEVLLPFIKEGLDAGDRAVEIIDKHQRAERMQRLVASGIDTAAAMQSGQLDVRTWESTYLRPGHFDQYAMIGLLEEIATVGAGRGTGVTRLWANMEWALEDPPGVHDLVEYESRLNYILPNYDAAAVCAYDVTRFSGSVITDILRTHPQVIAGGLMRENPFYVPPDEFLLELRGREAHAH